MNGRYQVVVVGGGPVGVALAIDLAGRGISCAVVERRTELSRIPKGQNLNQRTMEHFRFWGLAEQLRAARTMPPGSPIGTVVAYDPRGLGRSTRSDGSRSTRPSSPAPKGPRAKSAARRPWH